MSFLLGLAKSFGLTPPKKTTSSQLQTPPSSSPSSDTTDASSKSYANGTKRKFGVVAPTSEGADHHDMNTWRSSHKRQMSSMEEGEFGAAFANLALAEQHGGQGQYQETLIDEHGMDEEEEGDEYDDEDDSGDLGDESNQEQSPIDQDEEMDSITEPGPASAEPTPSTPRKKQRPDWHSPQSLALEMQRREDSLAVETVGWSAVDAKLYRDLQLRSLRPMLPGAWMLDFPSLPIALFSSDHERVVVRALGWNQNYGSDNHGAQAIRHLLGLGQQVRDRISSSRQTNVEFHVKVAIDKYIRWTLTDANLWRRRPYLPILTIVAAPKHTHSAEMQGKLVKRMQTLKQKWARALRCNHDTTIPHLYGLMVCHTVMALVAPTSMRDFGEEGDGAGNRNAMKDSVRVLTLLDWTEDGQEVWNAFAVATLGIHCRDVLLQALEGRELVGVGAVGRRDDPDA